MMVSKVNSDSVTSVFIPGPGAICHTEMRHYSVINYDRTSREETLGLCVYGVFERHVKLTIISSSHHSKQHLETKFTIRKAQQWSPGKMTE